MYKWTKVWAVQTNDTDDVAVGDQITVGSNGGESNQNVVSVTTMKTKTGKNYKVLLTQAE
jgi:hypothetical protein